MPGFRQPCTSLFDHPHSNALEHDPKMLQTFGKDHAAKQREWITSDSSLSDHGLMSFGSNEIF
jgi:hypothetical protein